MIIGTSLRTNINISAVDPETCLDIMIVFCCFQLLYSNTLSWCLCFVFMILLLLFWIHYLVCPTLYLRLCFHSKKLPAFHLLLEYKSGALRLASVALPLCLTNASANVRFRKICKHFILFQKRPAFRLFLKNKSGALLVYY